MQRMMEVVVTTGAISHAKIQSNHHHQQTNTQLFTGRMPFLSPNQQCQSTEGKISQSTDLLTPSSPGGLPTLSLTTNSSWLPWVKVAMPLIHATRRHLRSAARHQLTVPRHRLSTFGRRAFAVAGSTMFNALPDDLRDPAVSITFGQSMKTHLFSAYQHV